MDSSELAFKLACTYAFRDAFMNAGPVILEPVMLVEARLLMLIRKLVLRSFATAIPMQVRVPTEFQGTIIGDLNRRKGVIQNSDSEGDDTVVQAMVPLSDMFGYSTALRSMTQGKGEFTMEYSRHSKSFSNLYS